MKNRSTAFTARKHRIKAGHDCSFVLFLFLFCSGVRAQTNDCWKDIPLIDTMEYTLFGTEHVPDIRYSPGRLFDAGFATCWVSHIPNDNTYPYVFIAVPQSITNNIKLNIFSGYGKSESLFYKNSRPEKIQISLFTALVPDGYVSEHGLLCKALQSPYQRTIYLADTFGVQNILIQNINKEFMQHHREVLSRYKSHFDLTMSDTLVLVKIEILSVYQGTVYDDICISEIFFNNCYISPAGKTFDSDIVDVYVDEDENTLMINTDKQDSIAVYNDKGSILQIAGITDDNRWAVLISVPVEAMGRIETQYRIINLYGREEISGKIEYLYSDYTAGEPVYFEQNNEKNYLVIQRSPDKVRKIELRNFK